MLLLALSLSLALADPSLAARVQVASAERFLDSVGVVTHVAYFDTAYARWPELVERLRELGVRNLRDDAYANPAASWRDWNRRYLSAIERARRNGLRFLFALGAPGFAGGSAEQLVAAVATELRGAAAALEAPNELDHFDGTEGWEQRLRVYTRRLRELIDARPELRALPFVGPSFGSWDGPASAGSLADWFDVCNAHPYPGGLPANPARVALEIARLRPVCGSPTRVWATEAGYHNALGARSAQPGVPEGIAAAYVPALLLEFFKDGIERTYLYELVDELPDPAGRDAERHYGLLRYDLTPKPAFVAVRNLLRTVRAPRSEGGRARSAGISANVFAPRTVRSLLLRRSDGRAVVALWRTDPLWDPSRQRRLEVPVLRVRLALDGGKPLAVVDPTTGAVGRPPRFEDGTLRIALDGSPRLVVVAGDRGAVAGDRGAQ